MVDQNDIAAYAMRLGDDALIHGQRLCEWCADAPFLEEDIAIANAGLDYLGRARMLLQYAGDLVGKSEDELAFMRDAPEFRNVLMLELPRGDFAFSTLRQYLLDEYELLFFEALTLSKDETLAAVAAKTIKEVRYHHRRSVEWVRRLGLGTTESNSRMQNALDELWGYVAEFFVTDELCARLVSAGIAVDTSALEVPWRNRVGELVESVELKLPEDEWQVVGGRDGVHTEHLGHMLSEMQFMQRAYPGLEW